MQELILPAPRQMCPRKSAGLTLTTHSQGHYIGLKGGTGELPLRPFGSPPWLQALCLPGHGAPDLPSCLPAPGAPRGGGGMGTGNEINSLSKLLITGGEERTLQLRQGCFIYILGTTDDDC